MFQSSTTITGKFSYKSFKLEENTIGIVPTINASQHLCVSIPLPGGARQNLYFDKV